MAVQVCGMSGIVALFFSAICHAHYSYYSVAPESQTALKRFFEFAAFLSETFVFAYLGLQACALTKANGLCNIESFVFLSLQPSVVRLRLPHTAHTCSQ